MAIRLMLLSVVVLAIIGWSSSAAAQAPARQNRLYFQPFSMKPPPSRLREENENKTEGIEVAKWNFDYVSTPFIITTFVLIVSLVKIVYHKLAFVSDYLPESCALIIMGLLLGALFSLDKKSTDEKYIQFLLFDKPTFFLYLLPPIMLEAAYSLRDRAFFEHLGSILLFAVVGTIFNTILVSLGLWGLAAAGAFTMELNLLQCLVFGALIAAVDPVAVLAIFEEVGVNKMLYFMVFGESLLNDAVTVVLYNLMIELTHLPHSIGVTEAALGVASFFCVSCGAMTIGFLWGFLCSFVTKYTSDVRIAEPVIIFGSAYAAYLCAEMVEFSGIISIICCGIMQAQYAMENLSSKSYITVHYMVKVTATVMESLIFIILGVMLLNHDSFWVNWDTMFSICALLLCFVVRYLGVFMLVGLVNWYTWGTRRVSFQEQLIMGYGGLRGAVSFSLAFSLSIGDPKLRGMFLGATYLVILFTVFVQGTTMKPLVRFLKIRLAQKAVGAKGMALFQEFHRGVFMNLMAGVEEVIGHKGTNYWNSLSQWISHKFIRPALQKNKTFAGRGLLSMHQQLGLTDKRITDNDTNKLVDRKLSALEDSALPTSHAAKMLIDDSDEEEAPAELRNRRTNQIHRISMDSARDIVTLRTLIDNPAYRRMHFADRNLQSNALDSVRAQVQHRQHVRKAFSSMHTQLDTHKARQQAPAMSAMMRHMLPMAQLALQPQTQTRTDSDVSTTPSDDQTPGPRRYLPSQSLSADLQMSTIGEGELNEVFEDDDDGGKDGEAENEQKF